MKNKDNLSEDELDPLAVTEYDPTNLQILEKYKDYTEEEIDRMIEDELEKHNQRMLEKKKLENQPTE